MSSSLRYRRLWGLSYPLIVAGIGETVVEITDTAFLARYGVIELAAVGLAAAVYGLAMALPYGLVDGLQVVMGRRAGEGRARQIGRVFDQGLLLLLAAAAALVLLIEGPLPWLSQWMLSSAPVRGAMEAYLRIAAFAILFHGVNLALSAFYLTIGRTRVLLGATAVLAGTNIALDALLIFGAPGVPALGIRGAALASLAAELAALAFLLAHLLRRGHRARYGLLRTFRWSGPLAGALLRISLPVSLEAVVETLRWLGFFLILERMGEASLASGNLVYACLAVFLIPVEALGEVVCTTTSRLLGEGRRRALGTLLGRAMAVSYAATAPLLAVALLAPRQLLGLFTDEQGLVGLAAGALPVVIAAVLVAVPAEILYAAVVGTGDTAAVLAIQTLVSLAVLVAAGWAGLLLGLPPGRVWLAELLGWLVCLVAAAAWLRRGAWRRLEV